MDPGPGRELRASPTTRMRPGVRPGRRARRAGVGGERPLQRAQDQGDGRHHHARDGPAQATTIPASSSGPWAAETGFLRVNRYAAVDQRGRSVIGIVASRDATSVSGQAGSARTWTHHAQSSAAAGTSASPGSSSRRLSAMRCHRRKRRRGVISNHTDYRRLHRVVDAFEPEGTARSSRSARPGDLPRSPGRGADAIRSGTSATSAPRSTRGARNTKGLLTYAGFKKDALVPLPLVPASAGSPRAPSPSKTYFLRRGKADDGIKALLNAAALTFDPQRNGSGRAAQRRVPAPQRPRRRQRLLLARAPAPRPQRDPRERRRRARGHRGRALRAAGGGSAGGRPSRARAALQQPPEPAWFIDQEARDQWPFYSEFDGSADDSFDVLPRPCARTLDRNPPPRASPEARTDLSLPDRP